MHESIYMHATVTSKTCCRVHLKVFDHQIAAHSAITLHIHHHIFQQTDQTFLLSCTVCRGHILTDSTDIQTHNTIKRCQRVPKSCVNQEQSSSVNHSATGTSSYTSTHHSQRRGLTYPAIPPRMKLTPLGMAPGGTTLFGELAASFRFSVSSLVVMVLSGGLVKEIREQPYNDLYIARGKSIKLTFSFRSLQY